MWYKYFITHIILVAAGGLWHLGSLFYHNTHYSQLQIYFGVIFHETRHHAQAITSGTLTVCLFSGRKKNTHESGVGLMISLASAGYGGSRVVQHLLRQHLVFQPIWGWGDLGSFQLLQSNSHQKEPEISVGIFSPT